MDLQDIHHTNSSMERLYPYELRLDNHKEAHVTGSIHTVSSSLLGHKSTTISQITSKETTDSADSHKRSNTSQVKKSKTTRESPPRAAQPPAKRGLASKEEGDREQEKEKR
ncbi:hypothetical protein Dimus_038638 [Dionaea muscipula]